MITITRARRVGVGIVTTTAAGAGTGRASIGAGRLAALCFRVAAGRGCVVGRATAALPTDRYGTSTTANCETLAASERDTSSVTK